MCLFQVNINLLAYISLFTVLKDLSIVLWMCLSLQTVSFKEFSRIVYVFHCSVIKVLICSLSRDSLFTISLSKPFVNNFFQLFISLSCFCCDSVASCDSSYRIPRYSYNVNPKIWLFSNIIQVFQVIFHFTLWQRIYYTFYILCHVQPLL